MARQHSRRGRRTGRAGARPGDPLDEVALEEAPVELHAAQHLRQPVHSVFQWAGSTWKVGSIAVQARVEGLERRGLHVVRELHVARWSFVGGRLSRRRPDARLYARTWARGADATKSRMDVALRHGTGTQSGARTTSAPVSRPHGSFVATSWCMRLSTPHPIELAQHFVADATLAIHQQLAAAFRGDAPACRASQRRAQQATEAALRNAREALRR